MDEEKVTADENNTFKVYVGFSTNNNKYRGYNNGKTYYVNGVENPVLLMDPYTSYKFSVIANKYPFHLSTYSKGGEPNKPLPVVGYEDGEFIYPQLGDEFNELYYSCTRSPWMGNKIIIVHYVSPVTNVKVVSNFLTDEDEV